jgi:hypothetical protein
MPPYSRGHNRRDFGSVGRTPERANRSRSVSGSSRLLVLDDRYRQDRSKTHQNRGRREVHRRGLRSEVQRLPSRMPDRHRKSGRLPGLCHLRHRGSDEGEGIQHSPEAENRAVPYSNELPVFGPEIRVRSGDGAVQFRSSQTEIRRRCFLAFEVGRKCCYLSIRHSYTMQCIEVDIVCNTFSAMFVLQFIANNNVYSF